ncbi:MAG: hypothetical protein KBF58_09245 [Methyloversatilis sp.]|jgi:hypothetical protein|nr:hypothetical protein [Methyloversatilis sp.]MBP6193643.1 hypothetical protein [Methyloversatilis sp.]MBP9118252.1 hypothetical protein [Methyloversatilis sp.]
MAPKILLALAALAVMTAAHAERPAIGGTVTLSFDSIDGVLAPKVPLFPQPETGTETMQERHQLTRSIAQLRTSICAYDRAQLRELRSRKGGKESFTVLAYRETQWPRERGGTLKRWMQVRSVDRPACEGWINLG